MIPPVFPLRSQSLISTLAEAPGINRKQLLEKMLPASAEESAPVEGVEANGLAPDVEKKKMTLASDLRWLIGEGHVIEFNDGSLDLSRAKSAAPKPSLATAAPAVAPNESEQVPQMQESNRTQAETEPSEKPSPGAGGSRRARVR